MMKMIRFACIGLLCVSSSLVAEEGFVDLFNGKNLDGWMVKPENPAVWTVRKGVLARQPQSSYLWTKEQYGDFVLELEFKVSVGCNSGVFFRSDPGNPVQGGFEIQIMDSFGKKEIGKHDCGALYDAKTAAVNAVKPVGEWNQLRLEVRGSKLKAVLNGEQIQDLDLEDWKTPKMNPDGSENKFEKALKDLPRVGHIGFQDHGQDVWYRKVRLKKL